MSDGSLSSLHSPTDEKGDQSGAILLRNQTDEVFGTLGHASLACASSAPAIALARILTSSWFSTLRPGVAMGAVRPSCFCR